MSWTESHPSQFDSYDLSSLTTDQAIVNYSSTYSDDLWLYELSTNCLTCPYKLVTLIPVLSDNVRIISTTFSTKYRFRTDNQTYVPEDQEDSHKFCDVTHNFGEFGVYEITASGTTDDRHCEINTLLEPTSIYLPILLVSLVLITLRILVWTIYNYKIFQPKKVRPRIDSLSAISISNSVPIVSSSSPPLNLDKKETPKSTRLRSLDVFRGICIILMIFVHDGGAKYFFMQHASWDGLQVADVIFPWFLWIMGVCIPISLKSQLKKRIEKKKIIQKIVIRSLKIVALGLMLNTIGWEPADMKKFRIFGVLQRLGISYLVGSLLALLCLKDEFQPQDMNHFHRHESLVIGKWGIFLKQFQDITILWKGWLIILTLTLVHTLLIFFVPVPDCPTGYLGPGGLHNNGDQPYHCIGGVTGYVDRKLWGHSHIYQWPTANEIYNENHGVPFDPEGTLGYLLSFLQVWFGVQCGLSLVYFGTSSLNVLMRWGGWALVQGILGGFLCEWKQTGGFIPVNKNLWSLSFVLVTNSMGGILLGFFYIVNDVFKLWNGSPFIQPGMNSIFLYVVHLVVQKMIPWHWTYGNMNDGHFIPLVESVWGIILWICLAVWLKKKNFYVKL